MALKEKLESIDRLILTQVKVEGAKKHLRDLATQILALEHTTILPTDPDTGLPPHPIALIHPNDFQDVETLPFDFVSTAGDVVHNLRSALDHLAYQLVAVGLECSCHLPLTEEEMRYIEFPIAETPEKYKSRKAGKVKGMLAEAVQVIDDLKPYKGGNESLWRVHQLDIIDKHRTLFTLNKSFLFTGNWFPGAYLMKADNPLFSGLETQVEKDFKLEIEEAIRQPQVTKANALLPSLSELVGYVDSLVVSFRPLLRNVYERNAHARLSGGS